MIRKIKKLFGLNKNIMTIDMANINALTKEEKARLKKIDKIIELNRKMRKKIDTDFTSN